jgi:putative ABC transport system permease protein
MRLFGKPRPQADFAAEIESHIAAEADRLCDDGMSAIEAERMARRQFGNALKAQEHFYEARRILWLADLQKDIWQAVRQFRRSPLLAVTVAGMLALGIGATTAVFSIVDAVLLRPSPYPFAQQLVRIEESTLSAAPSSVVSPKHYQLWASRNDIFEKVAAYTRDIVTLTGNGEPEQVTAVRSLGLFQVLRVPARLGRTLTASDEQQGLGNIAVLSDRLWRRRYHADPGIIGREITVSDQACTIVGVMPPDFEFRFPEAELWTPLRLATTSTWPQLVARLQTGVSFSQAQSAMKIVADQMKQEEPKDRSFRIMVTPWSDVPDQKYKLNLIFVLAAISLVMLIACVDVGCLLLSRAVGRQKEIAIRAALGAGLWRITRQLLSESLVLTLLGSLAGIVVARLLLQLLTRQLAALPIVLPHLQLVGLNQRVLLFNTALCLILTGLCSLAPILLAVRTDLQAVFRGGQGAAGHRLSSRLFSALIGIEAGLAFLLLAGSGLMIRSLLILQQSDHGFQPDHVLTLRVPLGTAMQPRPTGKYDTRPRQMAYYREILERVKILPGIKAAAIVNNLPLSGTGTSLTFNLGDPKAESSARTISPDYFAAMGIPLVAGRAFADSDKSGAPQVAIINEHLARQLFQNRSPLGERLTEGSNTNGPTIVGVVKDSSQMSYELPAISEVYIPYQQYIFATFMSTIVVRTEGEPEALAAALRKQVWAVDPNQPIIKVETMQDVISHSIWRPRFSAWIFSVLSGLSLLLTGLGIYGVVAYTANARAHEVGVRVALGATVNDVLAVILRGAMVPLAVGIGLSVLVAVPLSRLLTNLLYRVSGSDPWTYLSAAALLLIMGAAASARPAWRAATRDPLQTLRAE